MSCGKEVRIPSNWAKLEKEVLMEEPDEDLIAMDELIDWVIECEVGDEDFARNYVKKVKPYNFLRCLYPVLPNNYLCRAMFKTFLHFLIAVYRIDDVMEKNCTEDDMLKICNAYNMLDGQLCDTFPELPCINEIKHSLDYLGNRKLVSPVTMLMDFVNKVISLLLKHGNVSEDDVFEFRRRLSNTMSIYLQAVVSEKRMTAKDTENETLWRRIFGGGPLFLLMFVEISSFSVGKVKKHMPAITEMYVISSLCCIITNDVYSYHRETNDGLTECDSVIKLWLHKKEVSSVPEAVGKITRILNAIFTYMYEKVEKIKVKYPNSPELHRLLDYIAYATTGWIFIHDQASPRYEDSPWRLSLSDVEENELEGWLIKKDVYGWYVVQQYLEMPNTKAKTFIDALRGVITVREQFTETLC